jgi:hypothetical protein
LKPCFHIIPRAADEISSVLGTVSPLLDDIALYKRLSARLELGNFQASIGSTNSTGKEYLVETVQDDDSLATNPSTDISDDSENDDRFLDEIYEGSIRGEIDFDEY